MSRGFSDLLEASEARGCFQIGDVADAWQSHSTAVRMCRLVLGPHKTRTGKGKQAEAASCLRIHAETSGE